MHIKAIIIFILLLSLLLPSPAYGAPTAPEVTIDDIFAKGQCTWFAADSRSDLAALILKYHGEVEIDKKKVSFGWTAHLWDDNFQDLYNRKLSEYVVDETPEAGAVIVWEPAIGGADSVSGHVGIVYQVVDSSTIRVREANWPSRTEKDDVAVVSGMHFIHTIVYSRQKVEEQTGKPFSSTTKTISQEFHVMNPARNIYVEAISEFVLTIDGKHVLSAQRDQAVRPYKVTLFLTPLVKHTAKIVYVEGNYAGGQNDPAPVFTQTWWPNSLANAAEPEPPVQVNYSYTISAQQARVGEQIKFNVSANLASLPSPFDAIQVLIDGQEAARIPGSAGSWTWNTSAASAGDHSVTLRAILTGYTGDVKEESFTINLEDNPNQPVNEGDPGQGGACSAATLDAYLQSKGSPMAGQGQAFSHAGASYNVDPRFIIAISFAESTFGRAGQCATEYNNAWGWGGGWPNCWKFDTWSAAVDRVSRGVSAYLTSYKQIRISDFVNPPVGTNPNAPNHCYCCSGCTNWVSNVKSAYSALGGNPDTSDLSNAACGGTPPATNRAPAPPTLTQPTDWAVVDVSPVRLCAHDNGDPDPGDQVTAFRFQIFESADTFDSGWQSNSCVATKTLTPGMNYQWRAQVRDRSQAESSWSSPAHFTIKGEIPPTADRPVLLSPANNAALTPQTDITLRWNPAANTAEYKVELWGDPYGHMVPCDWQPAAECHIGTMWAGSSMEWHVRARTALGQETDWSDTWKFKVENEIPPAADRPALNSPANGDNISPDTRVVLRWNSAANASQYKVEAWGEPYGHLTPCDWQSATQCDLGSLSPGASLEWHVRARSASGQETEWSDTWSFKITKPETPPAPPPPALSSPGNGENLLTTTEVTLHWNPVGEGATYKVELWGGPYDRMVPCEWVSRTDCFIGKMWPGIMQWRVRTRSADGQESDWSETRSFTIQEPPPARVDPPTLDSPGNGSTADQNTEIVLRWNPSNQANAYYVELWGGPYDRMVPCEWVSRTDCFIGKMWPGTMQWRVRARSANGQESDWSETRSFTIQEPPPARPATVELNQDLVLRSSGSGNWPPQRGDKLVGQFRIRNGGDVSLHIVHIGVRGRRGGESWDIGFWTVDLNGGAEWTLDANNERPLEPGSYSFRASYTLDGSNWTEIGTEINFTVP